MKNWILILAGIVAFIVGCLSASAHAAERPPIRSSVSVLCPGGTDTLRTDIFEHYQWLVDGQAHPGDTLPYLVVSHTTHAGHQIEVVGQAWGMSDTSAAMIVRGYFYQELAVVPAGSLTVKGDLLALPESGAELSHGPATLALNLPSAGEVHWFAEGLPLAETGSTLPITQPGTYQVQAAPAACPAYVQQAEITVAHRADHEPAIRYEMTVLLAEGVDSAAIQGYAWLLNGQVLDGETEAELQPREPGYYTLRVDDGRAFVYSEPMLVPYVDMPAGETVAAADQDRPKPLAGR